MADVHSPETRSYNMSCIRGKDTKPEEHVRKYLFSQGFRYRKNDARLPGKPDIVLPKYKTVIFVNGCFWRMDIGHNNPPFQLVFVVVFQFLTTYSRNRSFIGSVNRAPDVWRNRKYMRVFVIKEKAALY